MAPPSYFREFDPNAHDLSSAESITAMVEYVTRHHMDVIEAAKKELTKKFEIGRPKDSGLWKQIDQAMKRHRDVAYEIGDVLVAMRRAMSEA
jgi:hypothetical protein